MFRDRGYEERRSFSPVKVGDIVDVKIEAVGEKGDGIAKVKGFVIFVPNAKEGETVKIKITKVLRKVGFGEIVTEGEATAESETGEESEEEETEEESEESEEKGGKKKSEKPAETEENEEIEDSEEKGGKKKSEKPAETEENEEIEDSEEEESYKDEEGTF